MVYNYRERKEQEERWDKVKSALSASPVECPPLYTVENTAGAGKPVKRVVDAEGTEHKQCLEVNTETGRIVKYLLDKNGAHEIHNNDLLKTVVYAPTPITIEFF